MSGRIDPPRQSLFNKKRTTRTEWEEFRQDGGWERRWLAGGAGGLLLKNNVSLIICICMYYYDEEGLRKGVVGVSCDGA